MFKMNKKEHIADITAKKSTALARLSDVKRLQIRK